MNINKAVITAAGSNQRNLPLQTLIDRDGTEKPVLAIIVEETLRAGVEEICVVVQPGDEKPYSEVAGEHAARLQFVHQSEPLGYGHAIYSARDFVSGDPFLHLVGDHLFISRHEKGCAQQVVEVAEAENCAVSAVQATRESLLPYFGTVGGQRIQGRPDLYRIETVIEKPSPTVAEQQLIVPGLRAGYYLCLYGIHVLTPGIFDILESLLATSNQPIGVTLSDASSELAKHEQYLALEKDDWRYDIGVKYGLMNAQLALSLSGSDRDEVLSNLLELLAQRELGAARKLDTN
ncbi:MAG: UTP--glucose-1-phosphate uridylyltransferase [Candidatus Latescibacteria bacterium]|nr:UTP--glucose-1-phosphate uridylyltransferase [Candidatus Latescibacterota bacterium]